MNRSEAKEILQFYRPGCDDANDPQMVEALALAVRDPQLGEWLEDHKQFQTAVRKKLQEIEVPVTLKDRILAERKTIRPQVWWREPFLLATAAAIVLLIGVGIAIVGVSMRPRAQDRFADYKNRMVSSALREYRMDIISADLGEVRRLIATRGAPTDFSIPKKLAQLPLTGGGVLHWHNHPVAMVCFNRGNNQMAFLFVMDRSAVKDPPAAAPKLARVNKLLAASWSEGEKTYLLAGPEEADFLGKYF